MFSNVCVAELPNRLVMFISDYDEAIEESVTLSKMPRRWLAKFNHLQSIERCYRDEYPAIDYIYNQFKEVKAGMISLVETNKVKMRSFDF